MSVNATTTVSISPERMRVSRPSMLRWRSLRSVIESPSVRRARVRRGSRWSVEQASQEGGGVVAMLLHDPTGLAGVAAQDRAVQGPVLTVRVLDVHREDRDLHQHVVQ